MVATRVENPRGGGGGRGGCGRLANQEAYRWHTLTPPRARNVGSSEWTRAEREKRSTRAQRACCLELAVWSSGFPLLHSPHHPTPRVCLAFAFLRPRTGASEAIGGHVHPNAHSNAPCPCSPRFCNSAHQLTFAGTEDALPCLCPCPALFHAAAQLSKDEIYAVGPAKDALTNCPG